MVVGRGEIWWADLGEPRGSSPALRRPVVVVSADYLNRSDIRTVSALAVTSSLKWARMPGNVSLPKRVSGLGRDSVINVTQLQTIDKEDLDSRVGRLPLPLVREVDAGLRRALEL